MLNRNLYENLLKITKYKKLQNVYFFKLIRVRHKFTVYEQTKQLFLKLMKHTFGLV